MNIRFISMNISIHWILINKPFKQTKMSLRVEVIVSVLLTCVGCSWQQVCPSGCICTGERIICVGLFLTEFPEFPDAIKSSATSLDISGNLISSILSSDLEGFILLQALDFSANNISFIESGSFSTNAQLSRLTLSRNNLRVIPDSLFANTSLVELDLSYNDIGYLTSSSLEGVLPGATINLANNLVRTILEEAFTAVGQLESLSLQGNPIHCDCGLRWFPGYRNASGSLMGSSLGQCASPVHLQEASLHNITQEQLTCECVPSCVNGDCDLAVGQCTCSDGYTGLYCDTRCPPGTYGTDCSQDCSCEPENELAPCDPRNGTCYCQPGYTGQFCEEECPDGFYGQDCLDECSCENGDCHYITGVCNCSAGYVGSTCNMMCPPLRYGPGCSQVCLCETGGCHHITGECICPPGYFGEICNHNCTGAPNCTTLGRRDCSEQTLQHTCGTCLPGFVGVAGYANSLCTICSGAPNCTALSRHPCGSTPNSCGPCLLRHTTGSPATSDAPSNVQCFDPCVDGEMNYNEAGVDCGGPLCPPCFANQTCLDETDCGIGSVCLGYHRHPSGLSYQVNRDLIYVCVPSDRPGLSILNKFKDAFKGRENPLSGLNPQSFTRGELEVGIAEELRVQFSIGGSLDVAVTELEKANGDPFYQTNVVLESVDSFEQMKQSIHDGKLSATVLFNYEGKKVLYNF